MLVHGGAAVELFAAGGAGHVLVHVDVHVHRLHVTLEVQLPEEGAPAEVALMVLHLELKVRVFPTFRTFERQRWENFKQIFVFENYVSVKHRSRENYETKQNLQYRYTWLTGLTYIKSKWSTKETIKLVWKNLAIPC